MHTLIAGRWCLGGSTGEAKKCTHARICSAAAAVHARRPPPSSRGRVRAQGVGKLLSILFWGCRNQQPRQQPRDSAPARQESPVRRCLRAAFRCFSSGVSAKRTCKRVQGLRNSECCQNRSGRLLRRCWPQSRIQPGRGFHVRRLQASWHDVSAASQERRVTGKPP